MDSPAGEFWINKELVNFWLYIKYETTLTLEPKVSVDGPESQHCFLYYADEYHLHWNAYVNSEKMLVIKSDIGYKSVIIPYGISDVVL